MRVNFCVLVSALLVVSTFAQSTPPLPVVVEKSWGGGRQGQIVPPGLAKHSSLRPSLDKHELAIDIKHQLPQASQSTERVIAGIILDGLNDVVSGALKNTVGTAP